MGRTSVFWKSRLSLVLESYELLEFVDGSELEPTPIAAPNSNAASVTTRATSINGRNMVSLRAHVS
jgi:hypothetical protein